MVKINFLAEKNQFAGRHIKLLLIKTKIFTHLLLLVYKWFNSKPRNINRLQILTLNINQKKTGYKYSFGGYYFKTKALFFGKKSQHFFWEKGWLANLISR